MAAADLRGLHVGLCRGPIGHGPPLDFGQYGLHIGIVHAHNRRAVEWNLVDELHERRLNRCKRRVVVEVLAIDIRDHRQNRGQFQKRSVAFIRFHQQNFTMSQTRVGAAHGSDSSAHHHGGVQTGMVQDGRGERGGGGLSVASGHRDAVFQAHQFGQQFAARDHRNLQPASLLHFGILLVHRRAHHQSTSPGHIGRGMAFIDPRSHGGQPLRYGREFQIAAADLVTQVEQHFGDAAHANPSDAREVYMLRTKKHLLTVLFRLAASVSSCRGLL